MRPITTAAILVLLASITAPATAADVKVVTSDKKSNCRFIKFVKTKSNSGQAAALQSALDRAAGYGANGFYVMSSVETGSSGAEVDGQALDCRG